MRIGFTTSVPVEVIFAAGHTPIDLNNIFVLNNPVSHVRKAELSGFPRNICAWIKGMYSVITQNEIDLIIGVIQGDCSNTHSLMSILQDEGKKVLPFSYPYHQHIIEDSIHASRQNRDKDILEKEIASLEKYFNVTREETQHVKEKLDNIRKKLILLDNLTWQTNQVTASENHLWLVTSSDFNSDYEKYEKELDEFLEIAMKRNSKLTLCHPEHIYCHPEHIYYHPEHIYCHPERSEGSPRCFVPQHDKIDTPDSQLPTPNSQLNLGYIGVPPILEDIYEYIEECQAKVVFNEVQRQFSMPYLETDIIDQYHRFTYPKDIFCRIKDIKLAITERKIDGLIAYTQSFCHRQLDLISLKKHIDIPILQIEGDQPGKIDSRTKLRIESFIEMLRQ